jgi:hypothetical protein
MPQGTMQKCKEAFDVVISLTEGWVQDGFKSMAVYTLYAVVLINCRSGE